MNKKRGKRMRKTIILAAMLSFVITPALAQNCAPLKMLTQVKMQRDDQGRFGVPVSINGQEQLLLLNLGGIASALYPRTAEAMKLATSRASASLVLGDMGNSDKRARLDSLAMGAMAFGGGYFFIYEKNPPAGPDDKYAGMLAYDILKNYDVDIDFGAGTFSLFSTDHCAGQVVYWKSAAIINTPMTMDDNGNPHVTVVTNGVQFDSLLGSVSGETVMNTPTASSDALKIDLKSPDVTSLDGKNYQTRMTVDLGGLAINNAQVKLVANPLSKAFRNVPKGQAKNIDSVRPVDMALGFNVLSKLHVYVASKEKLIYLSPASQGPQ